MTECIHVVIRRTVLIMTTIIDAAVDRSETSTVHVQYMYVLVLHVVQYVCTLPVRLSVLHDIVATKLLTCHIIESDTVVRP